MGVHKVPLAIELQGISSRWLPAFEESRCADLKIPPATFLAITGPSGSGKTLLLEFMSGVRKPESGRVLVFGTDISSSASRLAVRRRCVHYGGQKLDLFPHLTILENVTAAQFFQGAIDLAEARRVLGLLSIDHRADCYPNQLSGGERQRTRIAQGLVTSTPILLMDEPTSHLDRENALRCLTYLEEQARKGRTVVITSQDQSVLENAPYSKSMSQIFEEAPREE